MAKRDLKVAQPEQPKFNPPGGLEDQMWRLRALASQFDDFLARELITFTEPEPEGNTQAHIYQMTVEALYREIGVTADLVWPGYSESLNGKPADATKAVA